MGGAGDPRRGWLRRALFQLHLWTGLGAGLYIFVSGLSGAALVFHEELAHAAQADLHRVAPAEVDGRERLTLDAVAEIVGRELPEYPMLAITPPADGHGTYQVGLFKGRYQIALVHPVTGAVTGPVEPGGAVLSWLHELHANLMMGGRGRWYNGIGGGLLFLLCVTGLVIWWPGRGQWRGRMTVNPSAGWKRVTFDLHNATGIWLLVPIALLAVTGSYFTWPAKYRAVVAWFSPLTPNDAPRSDVSARGRSPRPLLEDLAEAARREVPGSRLVRVATPGRPEQPLTVFLTFREFDAPRDLTRVFFDQHTGRLLRVAAAHAPRSIGDVVVTWLGPLHTGNFGGIGVKLVYVAIGLSPAMLFVTGFLMWWNRIVTPRWRVQRTVRLTSDAAAPSSV